MQQLKMMKIRLKEFMNEMDGLKTEVASLLDGLTHRGLEGKKLAKRVVPPLKESIIEIIDEEVNDFDYDHGNRFR
jgi:regulator of replication initiation timing